MTTDNKKFFGLTLFNFGFDHTAEAELIDAHELAEALRDCVDENTWLGDVDWYNMALDMINDHIARH